MQVQTYLTFDGRCEEALDFYRDTLGAEVTGIVRMKDVPNAPAEVAGDTIVHAKVRIGETTLLTMDDPCHGAQPFGGFSLSLITESDEETSRLFNALADGGTVRSPLAPAFFSSSFGTVVDRLGVQWQVLTASPATAGQAA
jgi:PhnB protein